MRQYTLGLYEKAMPGDISWETKLENALAAGYDYLEISIDETKEKLARLEMGMEERRELVCLMYEKGLPIRTMCLSGHRKYPLGSEEPGRAARGIEIMEKAIRLADDLGIRLIQLAGYDVYYEASSYTTKKRFFENLSKAVRMAASAGVMLGFETMETEFMNTVTKAMRYVRREESPYLAVYPDIGNLTNASVLYGTDMIEDMEQGAGHIAAVHLKETRPGIFREVPFGQGHVEFEKAIPAAWALGVRKYTVEFWHTGSPWWKEELFRVNSRMRELLYNAQEKFPDIT